MLASALSGSPAISDRLLDDRAQPAERGGGLVLVAHPGQDHAELVAAEARDRVAGPYGGREPLAQLGEEQVAVLVPEGVVDLLEPVQVDDRDGAAGAELRRR